MWGCSHPLETLISIFLDRYPEVGLLDHTAILFLICSWRQHHFVCPMSVPDSAASPVLVFRVSGCAGERCWASFHIRWHPPMNECIKHMCIYIHNVLLFSLKKKEILPEATAWMGLVDARLSDIRRRRRTDRYWGFGLCEEYALATPRSRVN